MRIQPFIIGRGNAGQAMARSLAIIGTMQTEVGIETPIFVRRGVALESLIPLHANPLLLIASPHGLHAQAILEGAAAGFRHIICEKPACVVPEEMPSLFQVVATVSVCHGYRQMWGPRQIKKRIEAGELGEIISIEGRYWQSSTAKRSIQRIEGTVPPGAVWKNDITLSGPRDVLVDLGAHWVDLVHYLMGESALRGHGWLSHAHCEAPHRDSHAHLDLEFTGRRRAAVSLSKIFHGAGNDLEVHVIGARQTASWFFARSDEIILGRGGERTAISRADNRLGSGSPPFHGMGWLEGYIEIIQQALRRMAGLSATPVPTLPEHLAAMQVLFSSDLAE